MSEPASARDLVCCSPANGQDPWWPEAKDRELGGRWLNRICGSQSQPSIHLFFADPDGVDSISASRSAATKWCKVSCWLSSAAWAAPVCSAGPRTRFASTSAPMAR